MKEKITKNYRITIGDKKRSSFIIKPNSNKQSQSSTKKRKSCGGCSRRRKSK